MTLWYYGTNDGQKGPVEEPELRALMASGMVTATTMVWRDGMPEWRELQQVPELAGQLVPASYLPGHYVPTGPTAYYSPTQTSGLAIASMVCGIVAVFTCMVIPGIPAVICGHMALRQINAAPFSIAGRGMAMAGLIMGYLCCLLMLCGVGFFIFIFVAGATGRHP